jgi:hypothetical protein
VSQAAARRPHHHHKTTVKKTHGDKSVLAAFATMRRTGHVQASKDFGGAGKSKPRSCKVPERFASVQPNRMLFMYPPKIKCD